MKIVAFKLGGEDYGVEITSVQEIVRMQEITKIPNAPAYVMGAMNLRGRILTVFDLEKKFGLDKRTELSRIIVVDSCNTTAGIAVENVSELIETSGIQPPPSALTERIHENCLKGVCVLGERLLVVLDTDKLFAEELEAQKVPAKEGNNA